MAKSFVFRFRRRRISHSLHERDARAYIAHEMVADSVGASVGGHLNGFPGSRGTPGGIENLGDDNIRLQRGGCVWRRSAQDHRP